MAVSREVHIRDERGEIVESLAEFAETEKKTCSEMWNIRGKLFVAWREG